MLRPPSRRTTRGLAAAALVALLATAGCTLPGQGSEDGASSSRPASPSASAAAPTTASATPTASPTAPPTKQLRPKAPIVVVISVDGLNPQALTRLSGQLPAFARLTSEGVYTLNARTAVEETITLPNHTGILTGRPVDGSSGHGVHFNEDDGHTLEDVHGSYVPGIFDVVHDAGLRTGFYAGKDKFRFLVRSWDETHGATDRTGTDDGRDKTEVDEIARTSTLIDDAARSLDSDAPPRLMFVHIADPDIAGHAHGWLSPQYLEAVKDADRDVGRLLDVVTGRLSLVRRATVILTADHGGQGRDHSDAADPDNYTIPFFVWGRAVRGERGVDLYSVNPGRKNPGTGRPTYSGAQPIRNLDAADLALRILRLPVLPGTVPVGGPLLVRPSR